MNDEWTTLDSGGGGGGVRGGGVVSEYEADLMTTAFWGVFTLGRFAVAAASRRQGGRLFNFTLPRSLSKPS